MRISQENQGPGPAGAGRGDRHLGSRGEGVLPGLDPGLNRVKPTDQAWLEDPGLDPGSVCLIATRDKDEKNLKPLLLRFQLIEVPPLKKREAYELMEALLAEKPVPSVDPPGLLPALGLGGLPGLP